VGINVKEEEPFADHADHRQLEKFPQSPYTSGNGSRTKQIRHTKGARCAFPSQSDSLTLNLPSSQTTAWRAVVRILRSTGDRIASVLSPADCQICGDPLAALRRVPICDGCWNNLPEQSGPLCSRCGESLDVSDFGEGGELCCRPCRMASPEFELAVAHGPCTPTIRSLLNLLKYDGLEPIAVKLGALLAAHVAPIRGLRKRMLVAPVPHYSGKCRERGFNQSELLARGAAMRGLQPAWEGELAPRVLVRQRATKSQAGLTLHERRQDLRGVFSVPRRERLRGRDVLLIDDIYTTGATVRACSTALKKAGSVSVWVATVARAQRHEIQFVSLGMGAQVTEPVRPTHEDVDMWTRQ
jgi:ComF family protein